MIFFWILGGFEAFYFSSWKYMEGWGAPNFLQGAHLNFSLRDPRSGGEFFGSWKSNVWIFLLHLKQCESIAGFIRNTFLWNVLGKMSPPCLNPEFLRKYIKWHNSGARDYRGLWLIIFHVRIGAWGIKLFLLFPHLVRGPRPFGNIFCNVFASERGTSSFCNSPFPLG